MTHFKPIADPSKLWGLKQDNADTLRANPRRVAPDIVRIFIANRVPITKWGPVGSRKTRSIEAMAEELDANGLNYQVITVQPSTIDPTVIHGLYYTSEDTSGKTIMLRSIPEIAERIAEYHEQTGGYTILFLDEMTTCSPAQQNAMLGLLTHGQFGDVNILGFTAFVMAANPEGTVSTVNPLSEAVINRGGHIAWYGDAELFLDEWSSGFGHEHLKPEESTEWFIRQLTEGSMEKAFRSENWSEDDLVPWELMEHTERSTTELSKLVTYINREFAEYPNEIRHFYLIKVTEALMGKEWANRMSTVCSLESSVVTISKLKKIVEAQGITHHSSSAEVSESIGSKLFETESASRAGVTVLLSLDRVSELSSKLFTAFEKNKDMSSYLAFWVFLSTSPNSGITALIMPMAVKMLSLAASRVQSQEMSADEVMPLFVTTETKDAIKVLASNI